MYISYDGLWQLLVAKKLSKTELCNLAGISSRTMAKLSKNESVTTDTLLRICETLGCSLSDIAELRDVAEASSIYEAYLEFGKEVAKNEIYRTVEFEYRGVAFCARVLKKKLTKRHIVKCAPGGSVMLETLYPTGISPASEIESIFHSAEIVKNKVNILLILGRPGNITGLDNGIVYSAKYGCRKDGFYVMTLGAFKLFEFKIDFNNAV